MALIFAFSPSHAQFVFRYQPSLALTTSVNFGDQNAQESSIMLRNSFRFLSIDPPTLVCLGLGYARRSYLLEYSIPNYGTREGNAIRDAFVLQAGLEMRFNNIRKIRHYMYPYLGSHVQWQFYKLPEDDRGARRMMGIEGMKISPFHHLFEIGCGFPGKGVTFYFALQAELPFLYTVVEANGEFHSSSSDSDTMILRYCWKDYTCTKLLVGIRF